MKCDECDYETPEDVADNLTARMLLSAHKAEEHWTDKDERMRKASQEDWYGD